MEELKIEYVPVEQLKEYKHNAKLHPEEQIQQIAKSIEQFGMNDPIAVDENNTIIEGHGRLLAIKRLIKEGRYQEDTVPIIVLDHLTDQEKKAYILAHNQLTLNTGFDYSVLDEELDKITDIEMADYGFIKTDYSYLDDLLGDGFDNKRRDAGTVADTFNVTFILPLKYKEEVDAYLATPQAKEHLVEAIIQASYKE